MYVTFGNGQCSLHIYMNTCTGLNETSEKNFSAEPLLMHSQYFPQFLALEEERKIEINWVKNKKTSASTGLI